MRKRSLALVAVVTSLAFALNVADSKIAASSRSPERAEGFRDTRGQKASQGEFDRAGAKARDDGNVRVLVGLRQSFTPEGSLDADGKRNQRSTIATEQRAVRGDLRGTDHRVTHAFEAVPYLGLQLSEKAVERLRRSDHVASVHIERKMKPALAESAPLIEADDMWALSHTGANHAVAILDTGIDKGHSFFGGRVVEEACFSGGGLGLIGGSVCPGGASSSTAVGSGEECNFSGCDHGTHVAGIAAGSNATQSGVAKGADIMSIQVFSNEGGEPLASDGDIIRGLEHVAERAAALNIIAANMSLGGGESVDACPNDPIAAAINHLKSINVATVVANGNQGRSDAVSSPACVPAAVSVGSSTKSDGVSGFSNNDPSMTDIVAPGSSIESSIPGATPFGRKSGTSMAAPHVAGAFVLLRQAHPTKTVDEIVTAMRATGKRVQEVGYTLPRLNIRQTSDALGGGGGGGDVWTVDAIAFGTGKGVIRAAGIECSNRASLGADCSATYGISEEIRFVAKPAAKSIFVRWKGALAVCGSARRCDVSVGGPTNVLIEAKFRRGG